MIDKENIVLNQLVKVTTYFPFGTGKLYTGKIGRIIKINDGAYFYRLLIAFPTLRDALFNEQELEAVFP